MRYAPCSTFRMSIKGGSTTCPTVLGSPRSHTACRRFAPLILPNWRASSRSAGSAVTEQPAALLLRSSNPDLDAAAAATVPTGPPHGRYQQGATQRSAAPWCPTCATHALPANSTSEHLLRPSRPCWRWMASKNRPRIAVAGFAAARWYLDTPENQVPLRLQRHVPDQLRCCKQPRLLRQTPPSSRRARSLRPHISSPLHNQPPHATPCSVATSILTLICRATSRRPPWLRRHTRLRHPTMLTLLPQVSDTVPIPVQAAVRHPWSFHPR